MSSTSETETEILLGNRHLLAIFFVLAVLLGIAFTGGYMVGRNSSDKKAAPLAVSTTDAAASTNSAATGSGATSLETHSLAPAANEQTDASPAGQTADATRTPGPPLSAKEDAPLGAPKQESASQALRASAKPQPKPPALYPKSSFAGPESGQTFLQVAAFGHTEAEALADVLSKKGFHAHAVPKPGSSEIYRVLIGPLRDSGELSATRDSLHNAGFTKIFVQRY
jgi:cell division septation protein DedD